MGDWGKPIPSSAGDDRPQSETLVLTSGVATNEHRLANSGAMPVMGGVGVPVECEDGGGGGRHFVKGRTSYGGHVKAYGTSSALPGSYQATGRKRNRGAHKGPRRAALTGEGIRRTQPRYPPFARIKAIKFSRLDEETLKRMSVVDVTQSMVYDRDRPRAHGVNDSLMGPIDRRIRCGTCHYGPGVCEGHPGRIPLPIPVYDEGCLKDLLRVCRTLCVFCCRTVVVMDDVRTRTAVAGLSPDLNARERVIAMTAIGKLKKTCPRCKMPRPVVKRLKKTIGMQFVFTAAQLSGMGSDSARVWAEGPWTPACVLSVLQAVPAEDWQLLGFPKSHDSSDLYAPVRMILQSHVCPPTSIRYAISVAENSKMRGQDDLTGIAQLITKSANTVRRLIAKKQEREMLCAHEQRPELQEASGPVPSVKGSIAQTPYGATQEDRKRVRGYVEASKSLYQLGWRAVAGAECMISAARHADRTHNERMRAVAAGERGAPSGAAATAAVAAAAASASVAAAVVEKTAQVVSTAEELVEEVLMRAHPQRMNVAKLYITGGVMLSRWMHTAHPREVDALQSAVAAFKRNDGRSAQQAKQRSGKVMRGMAKRLKGKQGRFRGHLQGKRCDQNARSVITPDPTLAPDELGVPHRIMRRLTIREIVTDYNSERLHGAVMKGPNVDDGATRVMRGDGTVVHLRYHRERHMLRLRPGWTVMRHLVDGDVALFNRQPSLQKTNIMGFKIVGVPGDTLRMNVSATTPFNADFDGDEMNIHIVQSEMAEAESRTLMHARWNMTMAQTNGPTMGIVQEALLGAHLLTREGTYLSREDMGSLVASIRHPYGRVRERRLPDPADPSGGPGGRPRWTGKQAFSLVLPPQLFATRFVRNIAGTGGNDERSMRESEEIVQIIGGELIEGILGKAMLGPKRGSLVHRIRQDIGDVAAMNFLTDAQNIVRAWMHTQGFSVGLTDFMLACDKERALRRDVQFNSGTVDNLSQRVSEIDRALRGAPGGVAMAESKVEELIDKGQARITHMIMAEMREHIRAKPGREPQPAQRRPQALHPWGNRLMQMVWAESKGGVANLSQILGCVGQQNVHSARIKMNLNADRTLPHFSKGCRSVLSRGLCARSYFRGLNPIEQYMHAMSGREGLVNTAVTTSETGYMSRKIRAMLEHITATHTGALVDDRGVCVQMAYGTDGMDPCELEHVQVKALTAADERVRMVCDGHEPLALAVCRLRDAVRASRANVLTPVMSETLLLPVRVPSVVAMVVGVYAAGDGAPEPAGSEAALTTEDIYRQATLTCRELQAELGADETLALRLHVMWELAPRNLYASAAKAVGKHHVRMDAGMLQEICMSLLRSCTAAAVEGGTACGVIAAGCAGAPSTQMSLDSFHHTGQRHVQLQTGVPRMRELVEASSDIRTPSMIAPIRESAMPPRASSGASQEEVKACEAARRKAANRFARLLRSLTVKEVVAEDNIVRDAPAPAPGPCGSAATAAQGPCTCVEQDVSWMSETQRIFGTEADITADLCPWIIRFKLDRPVLRERGGTPALMARAIQRYCTAAKIACILTFSDVTQHPWVVRIRPVGRDKTEADVRIVKAMIMASACANGMLGLKIANAIERQVHVIDTATGEMVKRNEWAIQTQGSTLGDLTRVPFIDWRRATTNDVNQVLRTLGIEAARAVQHHELHTLLNTGSSVDARHTALIADAQTMRGYILAATRHGINRIDTGVLQRASFEEMMDMLEEAATYGEVEHLRGVSENICVGQVTPVGTGTVALQRDIASMASIGLRPHTAHKLREAEPFPMNIDTRTGLAMTRAQARRLPLSARATRFEAEMARRKACVFSEEAREGQTPFLTMVSTRGGARVPSASMPPRAAERDPAPHGTIMYEITFDRKAYVPPHLDANAAGDEAYVLVGEDDEPVVFTGRNSVMQQQATAALNVTTRPMLAPGIAVPGGPVNSVDPVSMAVLLQRIAMTCGNVPPRGGGACAGGDGAGAGGEGGWGQQVLGAAPKNILRNVRVELSSASGVTYEEWTNASAYGSPEASATALPAPTPPATTTTTTTAAAPRTWIPATYSSSSRIDPWKGGPVRNARGVIIHAGGSASSGVAPLLSSAAASTSHRGTFTKAVASTASPFLFSPEHE